MPSTPKAPKRGSTVWLNKRALAILELPVPHTFTSRADGWDVEFGAVGRLVVKPIHGGPENVDVEPGDRLIASGEELYLHLGS